MFTYNVGVSHHEIATKLKALGDPNRLRIFQFLRCCPEIVAMDDAGEIRPTDGVTVGDVCCSVFGPERAPSTISFHLKELRNAGLIAMERKGKNMLCSVDREALATLAEFFNSSCCDDLPRK